MAIKSLTVFIDSAPSAVTRLKYALTLASKHQAHLIGTFIVASPWKRASTAVSYTVGLSAIQEMVARHAIEEHKSLGAAKHRFESLAGPHGISHEFRPIREMDSDRLSHLSSLHSDLVIVGHPVQDGMPTMAAPDKMLIETGIPFLIVPHTWPVTEAVAQNVLVPWNASRASRRSIADAMPLLRTARRVTVAVIDAEKNSLHGEEPGADVARHLCRHGVNVCVDQRHSGGAPVADAIRAIADNNQCDMIVLGAYSHPRFQELLFGGVTRSLLKHVTVPTLIAH